MISFAYETIHKHMEKCMVLTESNRRENKNLSKIVEKKRPTRQIDLNFWIKFIFMSKVRSGMHTKFFFFWKILNQFNNCFTCRKAYRMTTTTSTTSTTKRDRNETWWHSILISNQFTLTRRFFHHSDFPYETYSTCHIIQYCFLFWLHRRKKKQTLHASIKGSHNILSIHTDSHSIR